QHRGQDAAGMAVYNQKTGSVNIIKDKGFVYNVFNEKNLPALKGRIGIGHTRYPTAGVNSTTEVQPFFTHAANGIALAFNGNIINYPVLKERLRKKKKLYLSSDCDAEALLHIFAEEYRKKEGVASVFRAVSRIHNEVVGAYSVVALIAGRGILAFKDPNGIRPLVLGERKNGRKSYAFASESIALTIQGYNNIRDLKPGEAVFIDINNNVHSKVVTKAKSAPCVFEWVYFSTVESVLEGEPVYNVRKRLGEELAKKVKERWPDLPIDIVIPVPDTSRPAAAGLAEALKVPYGEGLVKNRYVGRTFIMPTQKVRESAMELKMKPIEVMIKGKNVMVVDDSIVRGTTSKRIVKLLRASGAKKVYLVSTFPPIRHPCFYGIDFQHQEDLIAYKRKIKEVEKEIGADKLIYMDIDGLKRAVGTDKLCMACLTGKYPTTIRNSKRLANIRKDDIKRIGC
ncbi:amidophosphoribosyltransferase, partial [Candidatus Woesearchaeota archaeon]|nr:amidophosphoribosyltransferase [Candidatus Woesearchaeota archaeon]